MSKKLIKVDRNGTKYWSHGCVCQRCGGVGGSDAWAYTGWTCYECGGSGIGPEIISKEYTPEYEAKLAARRAARQAKKDEEAKAKSAEVNREFFERQGFNEEGKIWVVLGKTYEIKEELKENGARWFQAIQRWTFNHKVEKYPTVEISVDDIYFQDHTFTYRWNYYKRIGDETYSQKIQEAESLLAKNDKTSEWFGEIGKRYELELTYTGYNSWEVTFGYRTTTQYLHKFKDENGNVYTWKTGDAFFRCTSDSYEPVREGEQVLLKATVKEHNDYKGTKQTVLSRCKLV